MIDANYYYRYLTIMRARRTRSFINDRGFRHIKNNNDKTGVTYAFWLITDTSKLKGHLRRLYG